MSQVFQFKLKIISKVFILSYGIQFQDEIINFVHEIEKLIFKKHY